LRANDILGLGILALIFGVAGILLGKRSAQQSHGFRTTVRKFMPLPSERFYEEKSGLLGGGALVLVGLGLVMAALIMMSQS